MVVQKFAVGGPDSGPFTLRCWHGESNLDSAVQNLTTAAVIAKLKNRHTPQPTLLQGLRIETAIETVTARYALSLRDSHCSRYVSSLTCPA